MKIKPAVIWGSLLGVGLAYEIYALASRDQGDTLSELVWSATDYSPLVPFTLGIICGHWFWPRYKENK